MVLFLKEENMEKLGVHLMHYGPVIQNFTNFSTDDDETTRVFDWKSFEESKYFEPLKRFIPSGISTGSFTSLQVYYTKGNPDYEKQLSVEKLLANGMTISDIALNLHVNSKDIEEYIEINRIIEEFEDFDEFIANQKKRN